MNSPEQLPSEGKETPSWLQLGQDGETESMLLGNAAGLEALRRAINQALQNGEGEIAVDVSDLTAVRCVDRMPLEEPLSTGAPWGFTVV